MNDNEKTYLLALGVVGAIAASAFMIYQNLFAIYGRIPLNLYL